MHPQIFYLDWGIELMRVIDVISVDATFPDMRGDGGMGQCIILLCLPNGRLQRMELTE